MVYEWVAWPSLPVSAGIRDLGLRIGSSEMKDVRWIYAILICLSMFGIWMCRLCFPGSHRYSWLLVPGLWAGFFLVSCARVVGLWYLWLVSWLMRLPCLWGLV